MPLHQQSGEKAILEIFVCVFRDRYAAVDKVMMQMAHESYQPIVRLSRPRS